MHWAKWLYNIPTRFSTSFSPFEIVYGKPPQSLPQYVAGSSRLEAIDASLTIRDFVLPTLKKKLLKAMELMKMYADKKRRPHPFKVGDLPFVKLRPYRQTSIVGNRVQKLSKQYYGPFKNSSVSSVKLLLSLRCQQRARFSLCFMCPSLSHVMIHQSRLSPSQPMLKQSPGSSPLGCS